MGRSTADRRDGASGVVVAWEAAAVSILMLLLSPITWRQHGVAVLPACHLLARAWRSGSLTTVHKRLIVWAYAVPVLVLDRGLIGQALTLRLDSLGLTAWSWLVLLGVALACRSRASASGSRTPADLSASSGLRIDAAGAAGSPHHSSPSSPLPVRETPP
jgi:hypothetical protein